ncbi:MAG: hypothetical protein EXS16_17010 [Gemmataceae bacterium]|nr:hypothetical protein [Gemmataceae bacterium]
MTSDNFHHTLDELTGARPFRIFTVELHGGRQIEIDFPGAVVLRDGGAVFVAPGGVPIVFDHKSVTQFIIAPATAVPE